MKKIVFSSFLFLAIVLSVFSQDKVAVQNKISNAVAVITSDAVPVGYGFFVSKSLLVTTINTIGKYKSAQVILNNEKYYNVLGYVSADNENDVVLLKTDQDNGSFVSLSAQAPAVGQKVYLVTIKDGNKPELVDATLKEIKDFGEVKLLTIEATEQLTVSGLPVCDLQGNVIGISVLPLVNDPGINFAIPTEKIEKLIASQGEVKNLYLLMPVFDNIKKRSLADMDKSKAVKEFLDQGIARYEQKDYKGAIEKFNMALRLSPTDADVLVFRGQSKYMLMQYKDAMDDFNKAIDLQSEYAEAYDLRGLCKAELGDKDGACKDWMTSYEKGYNPAFKLLEKFCDLEKMK